MKRPAGVALLAAAVALVASTAVAQQGPAAPPAGNKVVVPLPSADVVGSLPAPPKLQAPSISLATAVQMTVLHDPRVLGEGQQVDVSFGQLQQARGRFDQYVSAAPTYNRSLSELTDVAKQREFGKRELIARIADAFTAASDAVATQLAKNDVAPPDCPEGLSFVNVGENGASDIVERTGILFEDTIVQLPPDLARGQSDYLKVCRAPTDLGAQPETTLKVVKGINDAAKLGIGEQLLTFSQVPRETLTLMSDITQEVEVKAKLALERLGGSPIDELNSTMGFKAGYGKPFRNGMTARFDLRYQGNEHNYLGKSLDPSFGGYGLHNEFPSSVTLSLDAPLGKNRGAVSTAAPERASEFSLLAERETLRETVSKEVFSTVLAYVALQSAQQSLKWLEESAARQRRLVDVSQQLVQGGEMAAAELNRVRARALLVDSQVSAARASVVQARLTLAQAIGVAVDSLEDAPLASDVLPVTAAPPQPTPVLIDRAVANRRELKAAAHLEEAAGVLAKAARSDLKRRFDFSFTGGFNTLYESPILRLFPAEQPTQPYEQGVRYASPEGLWNSWQRRWRPTVSAQLVFELPTKNSAAHGRLVQEEASWDRSRIQRRDLERTVRDNVVQMAESVQRAAEAVARHREALAFYEKTLEAAMARFQAGDLTLIDTLTTEEDLTRQRQALVTAVQNYTSQLARLRYETGDLVTFADEDAPGARVEFDTAAFVAQ